MFDEQKLHGLRGEVAIGHTRYSTTGSSAWANAQPQLHHGRARTVALGHNGNLINVGELRDELRAGGRQARDDVRHRARRGAPRERRGAARRGDRERDAAARRRVLHRRALRGRLVAFRDAHGFRPLVIGKLDDAWLVASETCALDLVGAEIVREVEPGELVIADENGSRRSRCSTRASAARSASGSTSISRGPTPSSRASRCTARACGWASGSPQEAPADADLVLPIPDSGIPAAIGFARALGIPFSEGLIKNRYVQRTFIQPGQELRKQGIRLKYHPVAEVAGKRVVAVDDSIVRGNTTEQIVRMLFDAGATEVHVRISRRRSSGSASTASTSPIRRR